MSRTPQYVWDALAVARAEREARLAAVKQRAREACDDLEAVLLAERDDDIGDQLAARDDGPEPPEAA
jgi:hypothetical protein